MLQFVSLSGNADGKDLQTRRKVRSQAMRDFRRRQRAEREATELRVSNAFRGSEKPVRHSKERSTSASSKASPCPLHPNATRRSSNLSKSQQFGGFMSSFKLSNDSALSNPASDSNSNSNASRRSAPESRYDPDGWSADSCKENEPSQLRKRPSSIPRSPSAWGTEDSDPFRSPAQMAQMFAFCRSYVHWLQPGVDPETVGKVLSEAWESSKCPMLVAACCLASVGHLDAVQPNRPGGNYALYKARVLREVGERIQSPSLATSTETLGSLACLLSFELSRGSNEALMHLQGIRSIINTKGGMLELAFDTTKMMLETLDLLHAAMFDTDPILTSLDPALAQTSFETFDHKEPTLPLEFPSVLLEREVKSMRQTWSPHSDRLKPLLGVIRNARSAMNIALDTNDVLPTLTCKEVLANYRDSLEQLKMAGETEHSLASDVHFLVQTCHAAYDIDYNTLGNDIPMRHASNQLYADRLYSMFCRVKDSTWKDLSYLRLAILLTGILATDKVTCKSWFKAQLVRCIYQMGSSEWRRIRRFILTCFQVRKQFERPALAITASTDDISQPKVLEAIVS